MFEQRTAKQVLLGTPLDLCAESEVAISSTGKATSHVALLCALPLLSPQDERTLFRRMNYLLYRASRTRAKRAVACPQEAILCEAQQNLADEIDVCKDRGRQLEKRAMGKLSKFAEGRELDGLLAPDLALG